MRLIDAQRLNSPACKAIYRGVVVRNADHSSIEEPDNKGTRAIPCEDSSRVLPCDLGSFMVFHGRPNGAADKPRSVAGLMRGLGLSPQ